ncbi:MAG: hypothetical protein J6V11_00895 [Alphaproteobacteria bacterium]|nr:hypothetical protein [Alphaproteobacteria bacterium]
MKKTLLMLTALTLMSGCTTLTRQEQMQLQQLKSQGITLDRPAGNFETPNSPLMAGLLNILPGIGNLYLATGNGGDISHALYGFGNLLLWPISVVWAVPEGAIDAINLNKRELIYYYKYDPYGKQEAARRGIRLD